MKLSIYLKLSLFAFLCSVVCTIGYVLTEIEIVAELINWLWLATYVFLVIWLCTKVNKSTKYGVNLIFMIASFAMALYIGIQLTAQGSWVVNDFENMTLMSLLFVVFTIICLFSVMIFIGRLIFGNSQKSESTTSEENVPSVTTNENTWMCSCGCANTGKFCSECGKANIVAEIPEPSEISE